MTKVFAVSVIQDGYEQIIYIKADEVKVNYLSSFEDLDDAEKELFGNTELGKDFAVFKPECLD